MMKVLQNVHLVVIVLAVQIPEHDLEILICGDDLTPYNSKTHVCVNGVTSRITNRDMVTDANGVTSRITDSVMVTDANGVTSRITDSVMVTDANGVTSQITKSVTVTDAPVRADQENKNRERNSRYVINCRKDDILLCNGRVFCGRLAGYQCCGFETYHPDVQICCQMSSAMYKIHSGRSSKYICCELKVHPRRSKSVPCQHPASNDAFFRRVKPLNPDKLNFNAHLCLNITYAYKIHIIKQTESKKQMYLRSFVTRYYLNHAKNRISKSKKSRKDIAIDKYSPTRKVDGKDFVILSSHDHMSDIVFYLRPADMLFRLPKNNRLVKRLNKFLNNCRTSAAGNINHVP